MKFSTALLAIAMMVSLPCQAEPEDYSDPRMQFISAVFAVRGVEDAHLATRDACAQLAPTYSKANADAYDAWAKQHASVLADLPRYYLAAIGLIAEHEGKSSADVLAGLGDLKAKGLERRLASFKEHPDEWVQATCASFPDDIKRLSLAHEEDFSKDADYVQRLGAIYAPSAPAHK